MTHQQKLFYNISIIDLLLSYLPFCDTEHQQNKIMQEIRVLRHSVTLTEEMTRTEKQRKVKIKIMTIESELNNYETT